MKRVLTEGIPKVMSTSIKYRGGNSKVPGGGLLMKKITLLLSWIASCKGCRHLLAPSKRRNETHVPQADTEGASSLLTSLRDGVRQSAGRNSASSEEGKLNPNSLKFRNSDICQEGPERPLPKVCWQQREVPKWSSPGKKGVESKQVWESGSCGMKLETLPRHFGSS